MQLVLTYSSFIKVVYSITVVKRNILLRGYQFRKILA